MADLRSVDRPTAIVTDANTQLGDTIARALATNGFHVVLTAADLDQCADLADAIDGTVLHVDVRSETSVRSFGTQVSDASVLVISGAGQPMSTRVEADTHDWRWRWETRTLGTLRMVKAVLAQLIDSKGLIVAISSEGAACPTRDSASDESRNSEHTLHRLIAAEIGDTPVYFTKIRLVTPESPDDESGVIAANRTALVMPSQLTPAAAHEIAEVIAFAARESASASLFLDEVVVRPRCVADPKYPLECDRTPSARRHWLGA